MSDLKQTAKRGRPVQSEQPEIKPEGRERPQQAKGTATQQRVAKEGGAVTRENRVPMGRFQKLDHVKESGYYYYWFADRLGRLEQAKAAGYEFVLNADGSQKTQLSGSDKLYLMRIPEEWYQEDFEAQQKRVNDLVKNDVQNLHKDQYLPEGHSSALMRDKDLPI